MLIRINIRMTVTEHQAFKAAVGATFLKCHWNVSSNTVQSASVVQSKEVSSVSLILTNGVTRLLNWRAGRPPAGSELAPVRAHLAAEVASEAVDGAADVSELPLGRETIDVSAVPQHPAGQRHEHEQGACREDSRQYFTNSTVSDVFICDTVTFPHFSFPVMS